MRIGIVCFSAIGGSSTVAASLANELVSAGHTIFLLASAPPKRLLAREGLCFRAMPLAGDPLHPIPSAQVDRFASALAGAVVADRLDVVHAHYAYPHAAAAVLARDKIPMPRRPAVVTTLHGTDVSSHQDFFPEVRNAILASDGVSAVSCFLAEKAVDVFGIPYPEVIPNFINPAAGIRRRRPDAKNERLLVHISTLRPVKRAVDCVGILALVNDRVPSRLLVVGDGPEASEMHSEALRLGVSERISFVGATPHVGEYLAQADLLLLPSDNESFGMAALEAMAAGLPVVGSRVGGLAEMVEDRICGRLLPVGDIQGMATAVCELLIDHPLAEAYGSAGQRLARERYAPAASITAYLKLYSRTLTKREMPLCSVGK
jgi:N-acetyl-alpha-D-glucosaminyl L-malate synthase BshA